MILQRTLILFLFCLCAFSSASRAEPTDLEREARHLSYTASRLLKEKNYAAAEPLLRRAVALDARQKTAQYNLGYSLHKLGKSREAVDPLRRAVELDSTSKNATSLLASCYSDMQDYRSATYVLEKLLLVPMTPAEKCDVHKSLSYAYAKQKDYGRAAEQYKQIVSINSNISENWYWLGSYQRKSGQFSEALQTFDGFLSRFPNDKRAVDVKHYIVKLKHESQSASYKGRWTAMPIAVCLLDPDKPVKGYHENYRALVGRALKTWQDSSNGLVSFQFVDAAEKANIVIYWTDDVDALQVQHTKAIGLTRFEKMSANGVLEKVKISLLTISPHGREPFRDLALESIALHEVGHALGLPHSKDPADVMFPWERNEGSSRTMLSARDLGWLKQLYSYKTPGSAQKGTTIIKGTKAAKSR